MIEEYKKKSGSKAPPVTHVFPKELLEAIKLEEEKWSESRSIGSYTKIME
jgi:sRNA-binding carbon storage regulator CsrA